MAKNRYARYCSGIVPGRNMKASGWMNLRALPAAMMIEQRPLNLAETLCPLRAGLPLPEHHKSLAAYTTMSLCDPVGTFAENLHLATSRLPGLPCHAYDSTHGQGWMRIPLTAKVRLIPVRPL